MTLKKYLAILPLVFTSLAVSAEPNTFDTNSTFQFSTQVSREVDKDLMKAEVYSRMSGKNLNELKKQVSAHLNQVIELAKQDKSIELSADGISNYPEYDNKGKVTGWFAEGRLQLKSKNFEAMAKVLENLGEDVAIGQIHFSVSPEKLASLEDEMTLDIIAQFQRKAEVIQKGLNAKRYIISNVQLETPNGQEHYNRPVALRSASYAKEADMDIPLEAGKATISAFASGQVKFER
ncbi:SIMPL domain-containing protein [Glaesserella parasuis]|nr:SIMPL domain-containing protein [Glaesserella parasuis]